MLQRGATCVPSLFVLVSVAALGASLGSVRAADECKAKPNAPPPHGEHWYYRIDRDAKRHCWYLAPQGIRVQKNATEPLKQAASDSAKTPADPPRAPQVPTTELPAAAAAVSNGFAPVAPPPWPEAARFPDAQPSFELALQLPLANKRRSADAIDARLTPATDRAEMHQTAASVRPSNAVEAAIIVNGDHTLPLIMLATALLTIAGWVFHATRRRHRRKFSDHREFRSGLSTLSTCYAAAATARDWDDPIPPPDPLVQTDDVVDTLKRLLTEMQARQYAREGRSRVGNLA
jgi:hypothetical protein